MEMENMGMRGGQVGVTMMMEKGASNIAKIHAPPFISAKKILDKRFPNKLMVFRFASLIVDSVSLF